MKNSVRVDFSLIQGRINKENVKFPGSPEANKLLTWSFFLILYFKMNKNFLKIIHWWCFALKRVLWLLLW